MASVVVVGAGMAGLSAAVHLTEAGHQTTVLEARDRVGGRVLSQRLSNTAVVEMGGEWIRTDQIGVSSLAATLDLELVPVGVDFSRRDIGATQSISQKDHERVEAVVSRAIDSLDPVQLSRTSAGQLLADVHDGSAAMDLFVHRLTGSASIPLDDVGVLEMAGEYGIGRATYVRVHGGNQNLAHRSAAKLADVRLGEPVEAIDSTGAQIEVTAGSKTYVCDGVVVAVPLSILKQIDFVSPLEASMDEAISTLRMGSAAKLAVATDSRPPLFARQAPNDSWWCWTGLELSGRTRNAVTAFAGGIAADMSEVQWLGELGQIVDHVALDDEYLYQDWTSDEWSLGSYSALGPSHESLLDAFSSSGTVVFAGEYTSGSGSIDGAILSGEAAAKRLHLYLHQ
jgi:monoamine oxidase